MIQLSQDQRQLRRTNQPGRKPNSFGIVAKSGPHIRDRFWLIYIAAVVAYATYRLW